MRRAHPTHMLVSASHLADNWRDRLESCPFNTSICGESTTHCSETDFFFLLSDRVESCSARPTHAHTHIFVFVLNSSLRLCRSHGGAVSNTVCLLNLSILFVSVIYCHVLLIACKPKHYYIQHRAIQSQLQAHWIYCSIDSFANAMHVVLKFDNEICPLLRSSSDSNHSILLWRAHTPTNRLRAK